MKTVIAIASLLLAPSAIATDQVYIQLNNGATRRVFLVKTEGTSFGHVEVSGLPGKAGESSVAFNNSVQMVGKEVVLTEKSRSMDKGIVTENTNRSFIPVSQLPWTGELSGKPVRLFQGKPPKEDAQNPDKSKEAMLIGTWRVTSGPKMPANLQLQFAADVYFEALEFMPGGKLRVRRAHNFGESVGTWAYVEEGRNEPGSLQLVYPHWGRPGVNNDCLVHLGKLTPDGMTLIALADVPIELEKRCHNAPGHDRGAWVAGCFAGLKKIRSGMTRAQIGKRLRLDGGLQSGETVRYVHPECSFFKIDVRFAVNRNPDDQDRIVIAPDDKALSASQPYLEQPYND